MDTFLARTRDEDVSKTQDDADKETHNNDDVVIEGGHETPSLDTHTNQGSITQEDPNTIIPHDTTNVSVSTANEDNVNSKANDEKKTL